MLFAHIGEITECDTLDVNLLPKYHILNDAETPSELRYVPKTSHPLSERFSRLESCPEPDIKNHTVTVELTAGERHVHFDIRLGDSDVSVINSNFSVSKTSSRRDLLEKSKSFLRQLAKAYALKEICHRPNQKPSDIILSASSSTGTTNPSSDASDAENSAVCLQPPGGAARHGDRKRKTKPNAMEETWKLLDSALFWRRKPEKCNTKAPVRSVHCDKKPCNLIPIHIPLELLKNKHVIDPRKSNPHQQRKDMKEKLDLPLPGFFKLVFDTAQMLKADGFNDETDVQTQRPVGAGSLTETAGGAGDWQRSAFIRVIETLERSVHLLHVLDETEFGELFSELSKFQCKIDALLSRHRDTRAQ